LTICQVLKHQFYTRRVKVQLCLIINTFKCQCMVQTDWFWLVVKYIASFKRVVTYRWQSKWDIDI